MRARQFFARRGEIVVSWIGIAAMVLSFSEPGFGTTIEEICLEQSLLLP